MTEGKFAMIFFFILLGLLPSFAWLVFFLREDSHPEPKKLLALVFAGGFLGTFLALAAQLFIKYVIGLPDLSQFASYLDSPPGASPMIALTLAGFGAAFILAGTEEIAKFIPTYALIRKNISFDEPIDAMIYMITAGLGFALVENVSILITLPSGLIGDALGVITIRFVGATLLHALSSAIVGYYWAHAMANWKQKTMVANPTHDDFIHGRQLVHTWTFFGGLLFASLLHGIFNYLILSYRELLIYPTVFLIIVAFFVFWDFERLKSKQINADSDADQRRSSNPISVNPR